MLFIILYKVVLTFESVDEILKCDHSNESSRVARSCGAVHCFFFFLFFFYKSPKMEIVNFLSRKRIKIS